MRLLWILDGHNNNYAFIFVGHERSGFGAYFVACVCSFRLTLQLHWQINFGFACIVTIQ